MPRSFISQFMIMSAVLFTLFSPAHAQDTIESAPLGQSPTPPQSQLPTESPMQGRSLPSAQATAGSDFIIEWKVANRFRLFQDEKLFQAHETAWRQYLLFVDGLNVSAQEKAQIKANSSVLGTEHVLNDRFIAFSRQLRSRFDWQGWAAKFKDGLCWNKDSRTHDLCGGVKGYINPTAHDIIISLKPTKRNPLFAELNCQWRIGEAAPVSAPCDEPFRASLPYPGGADIAVAIEGQPPVIQHAEVRDLLVVGLGDSFASGEGNPDVPVAFSADRRYRNLYPQRQDTTEAGNAQWLDTLCHRSLYSYQLRAALQIGLENPQTAVTFLGYACSGASVAEGVLGPQEYVGARAISSNANDLRTARFLRGGEKDSQLYRFLRELCLDRPQQKNDLWVCPNNNFRRNVDYVLLSIGGNDIGFSSVVAWAALRDSTSTSLAKLLGATIQPEQFIVNVRDVLPKAYARLGRALEAAVPLHDGSGLFDASHVILTSYPDILVDETGGVCQAGDGDAATEDRYPANQSMDYFSSWLATTNNRLTAVHDRLEALHKRMKDLAGDQGWTFAGRVYEDRVFARHGFCAKRDNLAADPAEMLMIPCWGKSDRASQTCQPNWLGKARDWKPYNPQSQNYPYAMRQRWVRTFNDAYMTVNEKVMGRNGVVDETLSARTFSEATGAMHPNAEGQAAMADAMLLDFRKALADDLAEKASNAPQ